MDDEGFVVLTATLSSVYVTAPGKPRRWACLEAAQRFATARGGVVRRANGTIPLRCSCTACERRCPECGGFHDGGVMCA